MKSSVGDVKMFSKCKNAFGCRSLLEDCCSPTGTVSLSLYFCRFSWRAVDVVESARAFQSTRKCRILYPWIRVSSFRVDTVETNTAVFRIYEQMEHNTALIIAKILSWNRSVDRLHKPLDCHVV